jgi:thiol-disulfide isomerase/thioredoxin
MRLSSFFFLFVFFFLSFTTYGKKYIETGSWQGKLQLNDSTALPFRMIFSKGEKSPNIQIQNGTEKIDLLFYGIHADTATYQFPQFDSQLKIVFTDHRSFQGYWWNQNKKGRYTISLTGHYCSNDLFECHKQYGLPDVYLSKKWKTTFAPDTKDAWAAIGLFEKDGEALSGTFLTETGDYRYLDGNMYGEELFLSCFDGSHAFLFRATMQEGALSGTFFSGHHFSCSWEAVEDPNYELPDPNKLTYVVNNNPLQFSFKEIEKGLFTYPNPAYQNKVTIIQIMGSWCPNCMDETHYYMDLHKKYHDKGLEIILVGYESGINEAQYEEKLIRFKERNQVPFTILVGGAANKDHAAQDFSMLNHIISFPTSIFIDKTGAISKIHTGFNGPSTGQYYTDYMKETEALIQQLLGL